MIKRFCGEIYVILDTQVINQARLDIFEISNKLAFCGVDFFQLRGKDLCDSKALLIARKLAKIIQRRNKLFIVNDRVDIAYLCGADGVHLGKDDISVSAARYILGRKKIIGKTVHTPKELLCFQKEDVNYVSIGPVFKTKTKPQGQALIESRRLNAMVQNAKKDFFVIGGIDLNNIMELKGRGIKNIAVCRSILFSSNYKNTVSRFKQCLQEIS